jgi:hypothetical protein
MLAFWYVILVIETIMVIFVFAFLMLCLFAFLILGFYLTITRDTKIKDWLACFVAVLILVFLNLYLVEGMFMCFKILF